MIDVHAGTKYLGQRYDDGFFNSLGLLTPSDLRFIGTFDGDPSDDSDTNEWHWVNNFGLPLAGNESTYARRSTLFTADASAFSLELRRFSRFFYWPGGIDRRSSMAAAGTSYSQWGEGKEIMENYTHIGFCLYSPFAMSNTTSFQIDLLEEDVRDTFHNSYIDPVSSLPAPNFYWLIDDNTDSFPGAWDDISFGIPDVDGDGQADMGTDRWHARVWMNWVGWKFIMLRLGNANGSGQVATLDNYSIENPIGDFVLFGGNGDSRFNIREIRGTIGNPDLPFVDDTDSWVCTGTDLEAHFMSDNGFTTLPVPGHWYKGDTQGLILIGFRNWTGATIFVDNIMFTTPNIGTLDTDVMRVQYSWLNDSLNVTLNSSSQYSHNDFFGFSFDFEDTNMRTHTAVSDFDIIGFIPPTFFSKQAGDVSDTMSRISIVSQADWTNLLNTKNQPYFYGNGIAGGQTPNDENGGIFASPDNPLDYGQWYTMFVTPRNSDGDDTTAAYGYPQVVNFRFTQPPTRVDVLHSEK